MSQQTGTPLPTGPGSPPTRTQVARDEAAGMGRTTADAGHHVAGVASDQVSEVAGAARRQAKDLLGEARTQATDQARAGQQRAAEGLRSLAGELHQMADGGDRHGPASDLAAQAAERVDGLAGWLDRHEPGDLLGEVRDYARRRPGTFLLGAAVAGVLAGRLTRGAVDANRDPGPTDRPQPAPVPAPQQGVPHPGAQPPLPGRSVPPPYPPPMPAGPPPHGGPPMPPPPVAPSPMPPPPMPPMPPSGPPAGPLGGPAHPPPAHPAEPVHGPRGQSTTVGQYVEEMEQARPRHELRDGPGNRP
jgi:hypothetical protein